ncbi:ribonuclease HII [Candidatus Azambacteria bacterium]|nr:ribonuclease HII [Candidatus Azambacteria bacterium]
MSLSHEKQLKKKRHTVNFLTGLTEEEKLWRRGYTVIGVDEVGMGPLAGPVIAVAVTIRAKAAREIEDIMALGIRDSKMLSEKKRERIFEALTAHPRVAWGRGSVDEKIVDEINVLQAGLRAMQEAVMQLLAQRASAADERLFLCVDGTRIVPDIIADQRSIIAGDAKVFSIACASIIAKVLRDRMMNDYAKQYPGYGFERHKGYGTKMHMESIGKNGPCPIHRKSFLKSVSL